MKTDNTQQSCIYSTSVRFKKNIFLMFFALSSLFIFSIIVFLVYTLFPEQEKINLFLGFEIQKFAIVLFLGISGSITATVLGSVLSVLFELPSIFIKFDVIKNAIANKEITTCKQFAQKTNEFFVKNLRYTFLSVDYSLIKILKNPIESSSVKILDLLNENDLSEIEKKARGSSIVQQYKTLSTDGKKIHSYVVPIYFVNQYLGFWLIFTKNRLLRPFLNFLADIENYILDDQLQHVLNSEKITLQRQFFLAIDTFSDKITLHKYKTLSSYLDEMIRLTVETCNAMGGVCLTVFGDGYSKYFKNDICEIEQAELVDAAIGLRPLKSEIIEIFEYSNKYFFVLPIMITELIGYLYLIDDSRFETLIWSRVSQCLKLIYSKQPSQFKPLGMLKMFNLMWTTKGWIFILISNEAAPFRQQSQKTPVNTRLKIHWIKLGDI